jgi:hypothetical protein
MCKKLLYVLLITILIPFNLFAEWIPIDNNKATKAPPIFTILNDDDNGITFKVEISGFELNKSSAGNMLQSIDLLTDVFSTDIGNPEIAYISKVLAIPDQSGISVEIIEKGETRIFNNIRIQPARKSWIEGEEISKYDINTKAYRDNCLYPKDAISVSKPSIFRDFRIARVAVYPLRYNAAKKELQATSSITVRINFNKGIAENPKTTTKKEIAPSFGKIYRSFIDNYQSVLDKRYEGQENGHEVMLCIMPDTYVATFQAYADWKRQSGTDIHITKFSDIGANANNPVTIKDHIADAYHNWENPPTYVLLVGDDGVFPKKTLTYQTWSFANEDYFVEIDGNDYFPEMMIGRFTNSNDYSLQTLTSKAMRYEKNPYTANTSWFKKAICCSNNLYASQVKTKRFTANVMKLDGGFTSVDTLMSDGDPWGGSGCSMDLNTVINSINDGRSYLNYRGEGWTDGWQANCYIFSSNNVSSLNNSEQLTFVTSIGCGVAMFDANETSKCFGEEWIELGTPTSPRGAIAFIGPTTNTHTAYNNKIDKGIYVGMFREGLDTPGQAMLRGKLYMYNSFGDDILVEYQYRVFCVLGDPSVHIWKDVPLAINVNHPSYLSVGNNQAEFDVTFASSGTKVENAQVCVSGNNVFVTGFTNSEGKVLLNIQLESTDDLIVTVRGGNVIPYQGTITISQPNENIGPDGNIPVVDITGNTNGIINPNETANITFTLKNWGSQTANNVQATLSVLETEYATVNTTSAVSFGNLSSNAAFTGDPFEFFVKPNCPEDQKISLKLHITSNTGSWDYIHYVDVKSCKLRYKHSLIVDDAASVPNYRMDAGETVKLLSTIVNIGLDNASAVKGTLSTTDPNVTITDADALFGNVNAGEQGIAEDNYFVVSVSSSCPNEHLVEYSLILQTQNGNYPYETTRTFTIPVGLPIPEDITGPDEYGYFAISSEDIIFNEAPVYQWTEISSSGTEVNIGSWSTGEKTVTVDLPFTEKYYGQNYNQVRISIDGWIAFGNGTQTNNNNTVLPHNDNINCMVAAFWDDLRNIQWEGIDNGRLYYYNDASNHRFIIEWDGFAHASDQQEMKPEFFQIILLDPDYYETPTEDGEIIIMYNSLKKKWNCTIGIENHNQDIGLQYLYNNHYAPTASSVKNKSALKFTTKRPTNIVGIEDYSNIKNENKLYNYPNPFVSQTTINYTLSKKTQVSLMIYNLNGQLVKTLQNGDQNAGDYSINWNGLNNYGIRESSGIYFCRLQTDSFVKTIKISLLKNQ